MSPIEIRIGDIVRMKKAHPCGSFDWEITRVGADIGLKCRGCGRRILLVREEFERRLREIMKTPG